MAYKPVTHILFDMDGLLLNTEDLYTIGFEKLASRYGKEFTFSLKCKVMGKQSREFAETIINDLDLPLTVDEFIKETRSMFHDFFLDCELMPGVMKLVQHLHENNVSMGLATSSSLESYERKTKHHQDLFNMFPWKTLGTSDPTVKNGKPHPDIFLVAADKFPDRPDPQQCLVFEDSINGVRAARAAGMQVVMVPDPRLDRALAAEATLVLNSLLEFRPEEFGLPPYKQLV